MVKIDRCFVSDLGSDTSSNVIVQAVVLMASGLGMQIVAEGIETDPQLQLLKLLGCGEGQGYFLSRPFRAEQALRLIEDRKAKALSAS